MRRAEYTAAELAQWLGRIRGERWERAFVFFKHEEEETRQAAGPGLALRFRELAHGRKAGTK